MDKLLSTGRAAVNNSSTAELPVPCGEALVGEHGEVWLPYDAMKMLGRVCRWAPLSIRCATRHASNGPSSRRPAHDGSLSIINGTDVTLGDSVIGVEVLACVTQLTPCLRIELFRSQTTPNFVKQLYGLANEVVDVVSRVSRKAGSLPKDVVDLSDFFH